MSTDGPVVVVVEDDVEMNALECELLSVYGFRTMSAYTGREAIELCRRTRPDAVLLDVMLPEMDGFETCCRLRDQSDDGSAAIIMVSALAEEASRRRGLASGADAYLTKPFDALQVISTLQSLIRASA
ncbi:MAG: response regulator [Planctomycetes bacterium]|nr:response regulator [Planctomycetota bacterium]